MDPVRSELSPTQTPADVSYLYYPIRKTDSIESARKEAGGEVTEALPSDYFVRLLAECTTILGPVTLISINTKMEQAEKLRVEDAVIDHFWGELDGVLMPRYLKRVLHSASSGSDTVGAYVDQFAQDLLDEEVDLKQTFDRYSFARVELISAGMDGALTESEVSACELTVDLFVLQKAAILDLQAAEESRGPDQLRGMQVEQTIESGGESSYLNAVAALRRPMPQLDKGLAALGDEAAEWINSRRPVWRSGLIQ